MPHDRHESAIKKYMIIYLTKEQISSIVLFMDSKSHFFFGLALAMTSRKSLLMEANNCLVGTRFNSFFLPFSIRGIL